MPSIDDFVAPSKDRRKNFLDDLTPEQRRIAFDIRKRFHDGTSQCNSAIARERFFEFLGGRKFSNCTWSRFINDDGSIFTEKADGEKAKKRR